MKQPTPAILHPDPAGLAALVGSTSGLSTHVDFEAYQVIKFKARPLPYEVDGLASHIVNFQHAFNPRVHYRVGGRRFSGIWEYGSCNIIPAYEPINAAFYDTIDITAVWFSPRYCERILDLNKFEITPKFNERYAFLSHIFALLTLTAGSGVPYDRLFYDGLVASLVVHLVDRHALRDAPALRGGLPPARLRRVLGFIEEELQNDIGLSALAFEANASERHFCRMFRQSTGLSPHKYVLRTRLERAKELLRSDPATSITDIAFGVGFRSSAHFSTVFRNNIGCTPMDFRRNF